MKIRICNESGITTKILFVSNAFEIVALDNKFEYWEYMS